VTADPREQLIDLYRAAVDGANPESLTANAVAKIPLERRQRVWVFSFGKAAHAMAAAAVTTLRRSLAEVAGGVIVAPHHHSAPVGTIVSLVGDHPIPGKRSFAAAAQVDQVLKKKRAAGGDLGVVLISGGTSSLIGAPLRGMNEADLTHLYELLLGSGLDIHRMNAVRKRLSLWGAGRMAIALAPARSFCFAISDVPGDDIASVGSGPCVPDPTLAREAVFSLEQANLLGRIAPSFRQYLLDAQRGVIPETPKDSHPAFAHITSSVIGTNATALNAAATAARRFGMDVTIEEQPVVGDATDAGSRLVQRLKSVRDRAGSGSTHCVIWGGETTVATNGGAPPGGRCQQLALSAARALSSAGTLDGISFIAAGTDGRDGTTDAAGAIVDSSTWRAIAARGRDPESSLKSFDSNAALASVNALFRPGLTGTNVMDLMIGIVKC
jgi:glycerate 2-kinase